MGDFFTEVITLLKERHFSKEELNRLKNRLAKKYELKRIPTDAEILLRAAPDDLKSISLVTKPTRTISGVAPIALMAKPGKCPHGTCIYCPGGKGSIFGDVPQSYTGKEPSTMRSARNNYDPYLIVFNRLEQYIVLNQNPQKTEVIIQGGTFLAESRYYKERFIASIFKAMNDFSGLFYKKGKFDILKFREFFELPGDIYDSQRTARIHKKLLAIKGIPELEKEQEKNETSNIRCVGLTIETKPDWGLLEQGNEMLSYGCTRVELGIQATDEKILKFCNRGHTLEQSIESTRILKDLGFKINYHMMPGLPLSSPEKDIAMLKETISNEDFRPDMYKLYPTLVMKGTALYGLWKKGKYKALSTEYAAEIITEFKRHIPYWIRIMRVQRDIPTNTTQAGAGMTNLRQYIEKKMAEKKIKCRCIRCREAGLASLKRSIDEGSIVSFVEEYDASHGKEFFISLENPKRGILFGYCRLRFPSQLLRHEITKDSALLRELHVVGKAAGLGTKGEVQHKGLGKMLLSLAEEIARKNKKRKILAISGIGVREYYRKMGYSREGVYMAKYIDGKPC